MLRFGILRRLAFCALAVIFLPVFFTGHSAAQSDQYDAGDEAPLGDVARSLRKRAAGSQKVIDDDNLSKIMDEAESNRASRSAFKFLMAGEAKTFQLSAPDVTCSLAFNASAKSLLSSQYAQMELPPGEILRLAGPATIEGDALTVSVFNGTDWHVSEVTVALTVVKSVGTANEAGDLVSGGAARAPVSGSGELTGSAVRPEKQPDHTVIYRMRAAAPPSSTTAFTASLSLEVAPGDEWHWSIVQARGYPPDSSAARSPQTSAQVLQSPR